jgi:hypothetical protein
MEAAMSWASRLVKPYRVEDGTKFRLKDFDPGIPGISIPSDTRSSF